MRRPTPPSWRFALLLVASGLGLAVIVIAISLLTAPKAGAPTSSAPTAPVTAPALKAGRRHRDRGRARRQRKPDATRRAERQPHVEENRRSGGPPLLLLLTGLMLAATATGTVGAAAIVALSAHRRLAARHTRTYARHELHLSAHDETRLQDLEEAVEAIAGIVRADPRERFRAGQPYWALELHHGPTDGGLEWTICLVCEPRHARAIDHALANAYPDVRLGRAFGDEPEPVTGRLARPAHVERFRKRRLFIHPLGRDRGRSTNVRAAGAPLIELVAQAQLAAGCASTVRLQFLPAPRALESLASSLLAWQENRAARSETWGVREAGLRSPRRLAELRGSERSQHRSLFWFELLIAAEDASAARQIAASVTALRGDNVLHRRHAPLRARRAAQRLCDRFVAGDPPRLPLCWFNWLAPPLTLLCAPGITTAVSTDEVARLIELPTARLKGVPVRRNMLPRLPAPPDVQRADELSPLTVPVDHGAFDEQSFRPGEASGAR